MIIEGLNGARFELSLVGYQLELTAEEELSTDQDDTEWLNIRIRVRTPDGRTWEKAHSNLLVWEVENLASWLENVENRREGGTEIEFTEPNLRFQIIEPEILRIYFELESRPPWAAPLLTRRGRPRVTKDFWVDVTLDSSTLRVAAQALRAELLRFPSREPWHLVAMWDQECPCGGNTEYHEDLTSHAFQQVVTALDGTGTPVAIMLLDYDPHHLSSYGVAQARVARCGCVWIELKESVGINITTETVGVRVCAEHRRSTTPFEEFVGKHVIATAMFGTISALWVRPVE